MNIAEILNKYTKDSIIKKIIDLYPQESYFSMYYEEVINTILEKQDKKNDKIYTVCIEMFLKDCKDQYELSVYNEKEEEINIYHLPESEIGNLVIDEDIIDTIDEKIIAAIVLKNYNVKDIKDIKENSLEEFQNSFLNFFNDVFGPSCSLSNMEIHKIGEFNITSNKIIIADPSDSSNDTTHVIENENGKCYINSSNDTDNILEVKKCESYIAKDTTHILEVKNGKWYADIVMDTDDDENYYNMELIIKHEEEKDEDYTSLECDIKRADYCNELVKIKSSMIGLFELNSFRNESMVDKNYVAKYDYSSEKWYNLCCDTVNDSDDEAGIVPNGVVSAISEDNGEYSYSIYRNDDNEIVGIKILLIKLDF